jgi:hypothetical protein
VNGAIHPDESGDQGCRLPLYLALGLGKEEKAIAPDRKTVKTATYASVSTKNRRINILMKLIIHRCFR